MTRKQIILYLRDEPQFLEKYKSICNSVTKMRYLGLITEMETQDFETFLHSNKPKNDNFTAHHAWNGSKFHWWNNTRDVLKEKRKFLTYLLSQAK